MGLQRLPRSKCLLISWMQSLSTMILEPPKINSVTFSTVSPSICHEVMGPDVMILVFWMLSFKLTFTLLFHFHQIDGLKMETVTDFIFFIFKTTLDSYCSHEIKRSLFLRRKPVTNLDSILKSRAITLPSIVHIIKAMVFPVVIYGCELDLKEAWAPKNSCFQTVVLEKNLESSLGFKVIKLGNP